MFLGRKVKRIAAYISRTSEHRAVDPDEFARRFLKGLQILRDLQKSPQQRAFERDLPETVTPIVRKRA